MEIVFSKRGHKDYEKIKQFPSLLKIANSLLRLIANNPYQVPPTYEKLFGFKNVYSRRINIQHQLVYEIVDEKTIRILKMWTHYE